MKLVILFLIFSSSAVAQNINPVAKIYFDSANSILRETKSYQKAIAYLDKAIELDSLYLNAYNNKATFLMALKNYTDAKNVFTKLIKISPTNHIYYVMIGVLSENSGDTSSANYNYQIAEVKYKLEQDTIPISSSQYEFLVINRAMNLRLLKQDEMANKILNDFYEKVKSTKPKEWLENILLKDKNYYFNLLLFKDN